MVLREDIKDILGKNKEDYVLNFLLFIVGFSIPFSQAFNSISIGALFLFSFFNRDFSFFDKFKYKEHLVPLLFILFFIIQILGVYYSYNFDKAISNIFKNVPLVLLPMVFINLSKSINLYRINLSLYGLVSSVILIITSSYINIFSKILLDDLSLNLIFTHFVRVEFVKEAIIQIHPPYLAFLVVFIIVPLWKLDLFKNRIICAFLTFFLIFSLYSISSFMSIIVLVILFIIYLVTLIFKRKFKFLFFIFSIISCCFFFVKSIDYEKSIKEFKGGSLFKRIEWSFLKGKRDTSRPENWESVLCVSKDNLFFGIGTDGGMYYLNQYRNKRSESFLNKHNAHNQYLEILLRYGVVGLTVYLSLIISLIIKAVKFRDVNFMWFIVVFMLSSIVESYLQRQIGLTFFCFYALLFSTFHNFEKNKIKSEVIEKSFDT